LVVRVEAAPGLPQVLADRGELETVLVNLATNARDAMPQGGTLTLAAAAETVTAADDAPRPAALRPGRYVRLSATDTGTGMDAETLARAAEPFFSTKPEGEGTGLGLASARDFAEQSGGAFAVASEPGRGTTVTLWLLDADEADALVGSTLGADDARPERRSEAVRGAPEGA
jgi:signal transduction histidine kinase